MQLSFLTNFLTLQPSLILGYIFSTFSRIDQQLSRPLLSSSLPEVNNCYTTENESSFFRSFNLLDENQTQNDEEKGLLELSFKNPKKLPQRHLHNVRFDLSIFKKGISTPRLDRGVLNLGQNTKKIQKVTKSEVTYRILLIRGR